MKYVKCKNCGVAIQIQDIDLNDIFTKPSWRDCNQITYIRCPSCRHNVLLLYAKRKNAFNADFINLAKEKDDDELISLEKNMNNVEHSFAPRIVFDFDGVIHSFTSGWVRQDIIPDEPVEGIRDIIRGLKEYGYVITVQSSRAYSEEGINAIKEYMDHFDIPYDEIVYEKLPAMLYIDDRGYRFDGNIDKLKDFLRAEKFI